MKVYLHQLRIRNWLGYFLIATFGFVISGGYTHSFMEIIVFYLMIFLYLGFSFSINNCFDVEEDKLNRSKKNPVASGELDFRNALLFSALLSVSGVILATFFGLKVFLFYIILTLLSFFYSSPPLRFKSRFLLDIISHGLFFGSLLFFLPFVVFHSEITFLHYLLAFSIFYLSVILELRNHIEDYESDKKAGLKTTACILGLKNAKRLTKILAVFFPFILSPIFLSQYILLFFVLTTLYLIIFLIKNNYRALDIYASAVYILLITGV